jgi:soluble lytic murein transglycosylase-like protein
MKRHHLSGVRDVRYALLLVCIGLLPGCAVQPHQILPPANPVTGGTVVDAPKPAPRLAAAPRPPAQLKAAAVTKPVAAPAVAPAVAPVAERRGDAWPSLPGAVYAVSTAMPAQPVPVAAVAPRPAPALQPVALREPAPVLVGPEVLPPLSPAMFGDAEARAVRYAGGRCTDNIYRMAWAASDLFHVQPAFVAALIEAESGCNSEAVSVAGARGLMQLLPEAGAREGYRYMHGADHKPTLRELRDPATNIQLGVAYLGALQDHFYFVQSPAARLVLMIAAYNCGPDFIDQRLPENAAAWSAGEAARWVARRTPAETRAFVVAVSEKAALYSSAAAAARNSGLAGGKKNLSP